MKNIERYVLTCKGRKPITHTGFDLFNNPGGGHPHPWKRCAYGHAELMRKGTGPLLVLEDDVMLSPDFESTLERIASSLPDPGTGMLYAPIDIGLPTTFPLTYPPGCCDWGTQAMFYTPKARSICLKLTEAYLENPVAERVDDYRIPEHLRRPASATGVKDGFDVLLFKILRLMQVPILILPGVQHMCAPSTCLSSPHYSPFFPAPAYIEKGKSGWH